MCVSYSSFPTIIIYNNYYAALNFEVLQDLNGGSSPHPTQPPNVTHITITLYRVDVETVLPQTFGTLSMFANRLVGYCTIVIKVDSGCSEKFYVLVSYNIALLAQ